MTKRSLYLILLLSLTSQMSLHAGAPFLLKGTVKAQGSTPLMGAVVVVYGLPGGAVSNEDGQYSLIISEAGSYKIICSALGFNADTQQVLLDKIEPLTVDFILEEVATELATATISGKRISTQLQESAYSVNVIEMKELSVRSIDMNQLLTKTAGIRVRESGGLGSSFNYSLNGISGRGIRFFIDGIPIDRFGIGYGINNFPANLIERVEIYKGVVPPEFGNDALGGVIQLISRKSLQKYLDVSYSGGSFNTHRLSLSSYWSNRNGMFIDAQGFFNTSANNYKVWGKGVEVANPLTGRAEPLVARRFHDAYQSASAKLEWGWKEKRWVDVFSLALLYTKSDKELQHGATMAAVIGEANRADQGYSAVLKYRKNNLLEGRLDVNFFSVFSYLETIVVDTSSRIYNWRGDVIDERPNNSEMGAGSNGKSLLTLQNYSNFTQGIVHFRPKEPHQVTLSLSSDYLLRNGNDPFISNRTASSREQQNMWKQVAALSYQLKMLNGKLQQNAWLKFYGLQVGTVQETYITDSLGYRPVTNPIQSSMNNFGYGYAIRYQFKPKHLLKMTIEQAYRLPDPDEILGDGLFTRNNPDLIPEKSFNVNIGWLSSKIEAGKNGFLSFEPSLFYRNTTDLILMFVLENRGVGFNTNIGKVRTLGGSIDGTYHFKDWLKISANATYQDIRDWREMEGPNKNQTFKDRLPNTPFFMSNAAFQLQKRHLISARDQAVFFWDIQYVHAFFLNWPSLGNRNTKATIPTQLVHSTGISYGLKDGRYNWSIECRNLFNVQVYDNYMLQNPGRMFMAKFRIFFTQFNKTKE